MDLLEQYAQTRIEAKAKAGEQRLLENNLKFAVGDGVGLEWERGLFTWKTTRDSQSLDWEALALSLMHGMEKADIDTLKLSHMRTKPGVRRVYFRYDGAEEDE